MTYDFLKTLYADLVSMIKDMVVKRVDFARENETIDSARSFETYLACLNGTRYFYSFKNYEKDVLKKFMSEDQAVACSLKSEEIPEDLRNQVVDAQSEWFIENYEETNEYYRMLMGLPRRDDHLWIYVRDQAGIPADIPIHMLSTEQISKLEIRGVLAQLKKDFPDKEYLNYLGVNSIDHITARLSKPFEILRLGASSNPRAEEMFREQYYGARNYIMATVYHREEFTSKDLYDPVIGMLMVTLAARNTLVPSEKDYLNFEEILDAILESYGFLRYFQKFPFTYKRRLVIAMDQLLKVKGTDGVLVDVCKLFSPDNDLIANRYYLMKTHTKDADGNIVFSGDPNQDYTLQFVRAAIQNRDISMQEEDRLAYDTVTESDYLWQLSQKEKEDLLGKDFNLMFTKYVDVEAAYDITSLVFEVCCFINLLLYARDNLSKVHIQNVYATGGKCSLFTMLNFLLAAMAKRAHFDGNIVYDPDSIAEIWRFNYDDIEDELRRIVDKYELRIDVDRTLVEGFDVKLAKPQGNVTAPGVVNVYARNRELFDAILDEMNTTNDIDQYIALSNCKNILFTSATEQETFMKGDGSIASTYYEMLEDLDPRLTRKIDSLDDDDRLNSLIVYILEQLEAMFSSPELKYLFLNTPTVYATLIGKYIRIAINVFKSAPTQLRSINVFFHIGDRDPIRVIDGKVVHRKDTIDEYVHVKDELSVHKTIYLNDTVAVGDKIYYNFD